jgi:hypothetical protein
VAAPVIYKPSDEVVKWLRIGAEGLRAPSERAAPTDIKGAVLGAVGRAIGYGKGAIAGFSTRSIEKLEYRLGDESFVVKGTSEKEFPYREVQRIETGKRGAFVLVAANWSLRIKPYAWLSVSGARVPAGWLRNGMEVGYELLIEELAARTRAAIGR